MSSINELKMIRIQKSKIKEKIQNLNQKLSMLEVREKEISSQEILILCDEHNINLKDLIQMQKNKKKEEYKNENQNQQEDYQL